MSQRQLRVNFAGIHCSVKKPTQCQGIGYFRYVDKSGGEIVCCNEHSAMYMNIELMNALRHKRDEAKKQEPLITS